MTREEMVSTLATLPMKQVLIPIGKALNHGAFGFDYLKDERTKTRPALAKYLVDKYYEEGFPKKNKGLALIETFKAPPYYLDLEKKYKANFGTAPRLPLPKEPASTDPRETGAPTNPNTPQQPTQKAGESRPTPPTPRAGQMQLLTEALATFIPEAVSHEEVKEMIELALNGRDKEKIYIAQAPDGKPVRTEGHVHKCFERVAKCAQLRQNVLLVGPAGSGKTTLAGQVAKALGLRFGYISLSGGISENNLTGWLLPIEAGGQFSYVPAQFVDFVENGGLYLLDDIGCAAPDVLAVLNAGLANRKMFLPQRTGNEALNFHKDFTCIGATNQTHGDINYTAQERMSAEMLDRFCASTVKVDYDSRLENKIIHPDVLLWGKEIRLIIKRNKLERIMSTRAMLEFSRQTDAYKWDAKEWEESYFSTWTPEELDKVKAYRKETE